MNMTEPAFKYGHTEFEVPAREIAEEIGNVIKLEVPPGTVELSDGTRVDFSKPQDGGEFIERPGSDDNWEYPQGSPKKELFENFRPAGLDDLDQFREELDDVLGKLQEQIKIIAQGLDATNNITSQQTITLDEDVTSISNRLSVAEGQIQSIVPRLEKIEEFHTDVANVLTTLRRFGSKSTPPDTMTLELGHEDRSSHVLD
jgi:prefoldin subunit 5